MVFILELCRDEVLMSISNSLNEHCLHTLECYIDANVLQPIFSTEKEVKKYILLVQSDKAESQEEVFKVCHKKLCAVEYLYDTAHSS